MILSSSFDNTSLNSDPILNSSRAESDLRRFSLKKGELKIRAFYYVVKTNQDDKPVSAISHSIKSTRVKQNLDFY